MRDAAAGGGSAGGGGEARAAPFRNGLPMRLGAWLQAGTSGAPLARRAPLYVRLDGEVLSLHKDDHSLPVRELDLRRVAVVYSLEKRSRKEFKVVVRGGGGGGETLVFKCDSFEEMRTWATSVERASGRAFEASYALGAKIADGAHSKVYYAYPRSPAGTVDRLPANVSSSSLTSSSTGSGGGGAGDAQQVFAVKVIKRRPHDAGETACVQRECHVNSMLRAHANVVQTVDVFATVDHVHIVMELMAGGTLEDLLEKHPRLPEPHARAVMRNLFAALAHVHAQHIVHRDVRPSNVFCSATRFPMELALGDFGDAALVSDQHVNRDVLTSMTGDPQYMAAEIVRRKKYGPAVDMWSAGVIMFRLLSGELPFAARSTRALYDAVRSGVVSLDGPAWSEVSPVAQSLVRQLLNPDPHKRISALAAAHHHWLLPPPPRAAPASAPLPLLREFSSSGSFGSVGGGALSRNSSGGLARLPSAAASHRLQLRGMRREGSYVSARMESFGSSGGGSGWAGTRPPPSPLAAFADGVELAEDRLPFVASVGPASLRSAGSTTFSSSSSSAASADVTEADEPGVAGSVGDMIRRLESIGAEPLELALPDVTPAAVHDSSLSSSSSSSSTSSSSMARYRDRLQQSVPLSQAIYMGLDKQQQHYQQQPSLRSAQLSFSTGSLPSAYESEVEPRLVVTPSLRRIHERGLHAVARENPERMRRILSHKGMQQQLSTLLPYRRKLIVTARAFIAIFRMLALHRGHSVTRQLSVLEDQEKHDTVEHINDIVGQRKACHAPASSSDALASAAQQDVGSRFLPRSRGEDVVDGQPQPPRAPRRREKEMEKEGRMRNPMMRIVSSRSFR